MQTFLPYANFVKSAKVLDKKRLFKQAVEDIHIIGTLLGLPKRDGSPRVGYKNHPVIRMWRGYEQCLIFYHKAILDECIARGINTSIPFPDIDYGDGTITYFQFLNDRLQSKTLDLNMTVNPFWLGDPRLHTSHKSNLIRKDPGYYRPIFGHEISSDFPYWYPK
jgi:hypothetical protein